MLNTANNCRQARDKRTPRPGTKMCPPPHIGQVQAALRRKQHRKQAEVKRTRHRFSTPNKCREAPQQIRPTGPTVRARPLLRSVPHQQFVVQVIPNNKKLFERFGAYMVEQIYGLSFLFSMIFKFFIICSS